MDEYDEEISRYIVGRSKVHVLFRIIRKAYNYTQKEFAEVLHISIEEVDDIEEFKKEIKMKDVWNIIHSLNLNKEMIVDILKQSDSIRNSQEMKLMMHDRIMKIK